MHKDHTTEITRKLLDQGKIIEAGWAGFQLFVIAKDAPDFQIEEMRNAFYAGAQHLWGSLMTGLDPEVEPTEQDDRRMEFIAKELDEFAEHLKARLKTIAEAEQ